MHLMTRLEEEPIPHLTPNEQQSLLVLIQTTLEVRGLRFVLGITELKSKRLKSNGAPWIPTACGT